MYAQKGLVSVALATYNGELFLRKQFDSLLAQSYENFEIVVSDDNSTDSTPSILNEYMAKDNRVKWSPNPSSEGFIKNFERAIGICKGEIIFLCDQDDVWFKDKISKHMEIYKNRSVVWIYNKVILIDGNGKETGYLEDSASDYYRNKTALENTWGTCILGCATSYKAKELHKVLPVGEYAPAHDSWIQLALYPKKSFFIDEYLQFYRIHDSNTFGLGKEPTKEREVQAISDNLRYLKSLPLNKNLSFFKRLFFFCIYIAKNIRKFYRRFVLG